MRRTLAALSLVLALGACASGGSLGPSGMPSSPEAALNLQLANAALAGGSAEDAIQLYQTVQAEEPGSIPAMLGLAAAQTASGDPVAALASYQEAQRLAPNDRIVSLGLARKLLDLDRAGEAETLLRSLAGTAGTGPRDVTAWNMLGVALDRQGRHGEAQTVYRSGLALAPASIPLRNNLALSMALSGDPREAIEILQLLPPSPAIAKRVRHNLAVALLADGDEPAARELLAQDLPAAQLDAVMEQLRVLQPVQTAQIAP
ncbi:tetratricopeptide repeat protein (plasmid) [Geminicoccaceae bacterium 1502E]|nr:tetratricopeptide repeat protein [Geminicoccaceae bacterium 1502E]